MVNSSTEFMQEGEPVARLLENINRSFYDVYEWDKHDYSEGSGFLYHNEVDPAPREVWDLDLTKRKENYGIWGSSLEDIQNHVLFHVVNNSIENSSELQQFFSEKDAEHQKELAVKNITNAWRDEFALNDPIDGDAKDRMRVAEWRITMAYYAVYKATSAMIRSKCFSKKDGGSEHSGMWSFHMQKFMDELGNSLYAYPFMFFPRDSGPHHTKWFDWVVSYPIQDEFKADQREVMKEAAVNRLSAIHSKALNIWGEDETFVTFYDLLLKLRQWASYEKGGIFSRLYGEGLRKFIDEALRLITFVGMTIAEVGLIFSIGISEFNRIYTDYKRSCEEGVEDGSALIDRRMDVYSQAFD